RISLIAPAEDASGSKLSAPRTRSLSSAASLNLPDHGPGWERSWWECMMHQEICFTRAGVGPDLPNKALRNFAHGSIYSKALHLHSPTLLKARTLKAFTG